MKRKRGRFRSTAQEDLAHMLHHANPQSPIVRIARSFTNGEPLSEKKLSTLRRALTSPKTTHVERCLSAWCLGGIDADHPDRLAVADTLATIMTDGHPAGDSFNRGGVSAFLSSGGATFLFVTGVVVMALINGNLLRLDGYSARPAFSMQVWGNLFGLGTIVGGVVLLPFTIAYAQSQELKLKVWAARGLGKIAGPQHISALAHALLSDHVVLAGEAHEPLLQVLMRIEPEDAGKLPTTASQALCAVAGTQGRRFDLVAIRVIGMISNGEAIQPMQRLAEKGEPVIAEAARKALRAIEERMRQSGDHGKLLRPSELETEANLLRPAANTATSEDQLVRPLDS